LSHTIITNSSKTQRDGTHLHRPCVTSSLSETQRDGTICIFPVTHHHCQRLGEMEPIFIFHVSHHHHHHQRLGEMEPISIFPVSKLLAETYLILHAYWWHVNKQEQQHHEQYPKQTLPTGSTPSNSQ
jgi:hypothetical protein